MFRCGEGENGEEAFVAPKNKPEQGQLDFLDWFLEPILPLLQVPSLVVKSSKVIRPVGSWGLNRNKEFHSRSHLEPEGFG